MSEALNIIVVGGGISGFSAAITLSRAGHNVRLLEQSSFKREVGFMITLGANAIRVLTSFEFNFQNARACATDSIDQYDGKTLEQINHFPLDIHTKILGNAPATKTSTFYRPDLHNELRRIALLQSQSFKSPKLCLGSRVMEVDIETATVHLEDGSVLSADLLVGADGERSLIKKAFNDPEPLRMAQYRVFRSLIPTADLVSNPDSRDLLEMTKGRFAMFIDDGRVLSWFEGRDGALQDLEAGYLLGPEDESRGGITLYHFEIEVLKEVESDPAKARQSMLRKYAEFHPSIVDVLQQTDFVSDYEVYFNKPLTHLHKSKAVLLGDAAHSMFPTTGQGGSQSLEDAGCLGVLLSGCSLDMLDARLRAYERVRQSRVGTVQMLSALVFGQEEEVSGREGHFIRGTGIRSAEGHIEFLYNYDVIRESERVLEREGRVMAQL